MGELLIVMKEEMKRWRIISRICLNTMIEGFDDEAIINILFDLFSFIYENKEIPTKWMIRIFVPNPKKPNSTECSDYTSIALQIILLLYCRL